MWPNMATPEPTPTAEATLAALRGESQAAALAARATVAHAGSADGREARARLRGEVTTLLALDIRPSDAGLARWLLDEETAAQVARGSGASEALYTLVAVVARYAAPEDALRIWRAHEATPETRAGVDVEQVGRLGVTQTRAAVQRIIDAGGVQAQEAQHALAWLDEGAATGAFDDLAGYFLWADERFGLRISGPT